ncbi:Uncharacterized protein OBRU01_25948 [Operophtera brumata]|uniref:Uncharacterized protein n=1 Tax=Operophtera brumata TaxID=104452 RepID=A0A0L7K400_OPEBR|nr:Uncharacterized protein OBRU01_25948 [Operophtera brumata]
MAKEDDGLFLLEVLIDKIVFTKTPCFSDKGFRTYVNFQWPSVESLEICDDPDLAKRGENLSINFNNGRSCLFSLKGNDVGKAMSNFPIKVSIYKSLPCGCLPNKIVMAETTIDMTKEFAQARKSYLQDPSSVSYQALKDSFRIIEPVNKEEAGVICMFLRISCFGKMINTRFIGPGNQGSFIENSLDRSRQPRREYQTYSCHVEACKGTSSPVSPSGGTTVPDGSTHTAPPDQNTSENLPCEDADDPCFCTGPKPPCKPQMECRNTDQYCLHVPKGRSKQFEEIGSNLGGNELKIKVPASASIIKKISQTHCAMQCPYTKGTDGGPCVTPCGKNQISLALPNEDTCCQGAQPAGTQFTCTTEGCTQASKHGQQAALARGDAKQELPNIEVFVLKVAKTAIQGDRKCKLELELVAPKGPDKKLPVQKVNARIQSEPDCECCIRRPLGKGKRKR